MAFSDEQRLTDLHTWCRKVSQAAANKADKASLELQRVQGENEVEQQKAESLEQQDAALKVSRLKTDLHVWIPGAVLALDASHEPHDSH